MSQKRKIALPDEIFDASFKLLKCQREQMRSMMERGMSYKELGDYYNISKSGAYYICNPKAAEKKVEKWKKDAAKYYDSKRRVETVTRSRKKVKSIIEQFKKAS